MENINLYIIYGLLSVFIIFLGFLTKAFWNLNKTQQLTIKSKDHTINDLKNRLELYEPEKTLKTIKSYKELSEKEKEAEVKEIEKKVQELQKELQKVKKELNKKRDKIYTKEHGTYFTYHGIKIICEIILKTKKYKDSDVIPKSVITNWFKVVTENIEELEKELGIL